MTRSNIMSVGLAIFSMFFGAGDLIFAVFVGKTYQGQTPLALTGFLLTAAFLPVLGVMSILAFDGNYRAYFGRLGKYSGTALALITMAVIAPAVSMPRIVSLSFEVAKPWAPWMSPLMFAVLFLGFIFLLTMSESRIIDILGYVISPLLLISLFTIFGFAIWQPGATAVSEVPVADILVNNVTYGYHTLNFLTSIFFGAIVVSILKKAQAERCDSSAETNIVGLGLKGSIVGVSLLGLIYMGLAFTGAFHSQGMGPLSEGQVFSLLMFRMLGDNGGILLTVAVLMACISTIIALAAVSAEFLKENIFNGWLNYRATLLVSLLITGVVSIYGLSNIIAISGPIISVLHPAIIVLAVSNLLFKRFGFAYVKTPVALTLAISLWFQKASLLALIGQ